MHDTSAFTWSHHILGGVTCNVDTCNRAGRTQEQLDVHRNNFTHLPGEVCSLNGGLPRRSLSAIVYHQPLLLLDGSTPEDGQMHQLVQVTA